MPTAVLQEVIKRLKVCSTQQKHLVLAPLHVPACSRRCQPTAGGHRPSWCVKVGGSLTCFSLPDWVRVNGSSFFSAVYWCRDTAGALHLLTLLSFSTVNHGGLTPKGTITHLRARRTAGGRCCSPEWWWRTASPRGCTPCHGKSNTWTRLPPLLDRKGDAQVGEYRVYLTVGSNSWKVCRKSNDEQQRSRFTQETGLNSWHQHEDDRIIIPWCLLLFQTKTEEFRTHEVVLILLKMTGQTTKPSQGQKNCCVEFKGLYHKDKLSEL